MFRLKVLCLFVLVNYVGGIYYHTFTGKPVSNSTIANMRELNLIPWCILDIDKCNPNEPRRMDLSCNNLHLPSRGAVMTPFARMIPPMFGGDGGIRNSVSGGPLPNVRAVRVAIMPDGRLANHRYTQLVTYFQVSVTGDITSVQDTFNYVVVTTTCCSPGGRNDPRCNPIEVYPDDVHLRRSDIRCLNMTTAITYTRLGCVPDSAPRERINLAAPLLDLSGVYGHFGARALLTRELVGGRLTAEVLNEKEWPPSGAPFCVNNEPPLETRCHNSASSGGNSVLGVNIFYLWWFRNHNRIARRLQHLNPCWDDDRLYYTAREINIAMQNQILYYELSPALAGAEFLIRNGAIYNTLDHVNDYNPKLMPAVSIDYVTASRWYHSIQEGRLKLYTKDGRLYDELAIVDFTLRTGALPINHTLEGITQGAFRQPCGTSKMVVDPDVGERILGRLQRASDVIASDIMKTRDFGMPPYVHYRAACGLPVPKKFEDLLGWMNREQVEALSLSYESVYDIDIQVGILAERPMPGVALGPTFACITVDQMKRWRQADRFWYENNQHPGAFTIDQLHEIRKMTVAKLICDNAEQVDRIQPAAFLLIGEGNELISCSEIAEPNLDFWKDDNCLSKYSHRANIHTSNPSEMNEQNWNQNPHMRYSPFMPDKGYIPNRDRLITPWVGVFQPIDDKLTRPNELYTDRPIYGMNMPSSADGYYNIPDRDQMYSSPSTETEVGMNEYASSYSSPELEDKIDSDQQPTAFRNLDVMKPKDDFKIKINDADIQASENIALKAASTNLNKMENTKNEKSTSMTQAQLEFLERISKEGQAGFEELGFFAVLPKDLKLDGSESLQSVRTLAPRNITDNVRSFFANLTRLIDIRPKILNYIPTY